MSSIGNKIKRLFSKPKKVKPNPACDNCVHMWPTETPGVKFCARHRTLVDVSDKCKNHRYNCKYAD